MVDYHIHTRFSQDSDAEMEAQCEAALAMGLGEVAFTEHEDYNPDDPTSFFFRHADYMLELERCRAVFTGRLKILAGIEISEPHRYPREAGAVLASHPWDFVLGSLHWVDGRHNAFLRDFFTKFGDWRASFRMYFGELLDLARDGDFDVMSHIDYPARYGHTVYGDAYDIAEYEDLLRPALRMLASRGKGIEINTNPLWRNKTHPNPPGIVVRWFREEGGTLLTVGSDSHRPATTGAHIQTALKLAREAGFTQVATFERRVPRLVDIPRV